MNSYTIATRLVALSLGLPMLACAASENTSIKTCFDQGGKVSIVSSSHQDTAWMDTPATCRQFRIEHNIMPALEMMRKHSDYTFCMECSLHVMEFLEAHPELRGEVIQRMKEGRLEFGATYNQPYESWFSGEDLIRETYLGRRWIKENLPGCDAKVAFNPDPPARSLQMQQILSKSGIPYLFISRYHEGLYRWQSPDGSGVLAYTPGHYGNHLPLLNSTPANCVGAIQAKLVQQSPYYLAHQIPPTYCLINSMDFSKTVDFNPLIKEWNQRGAPPTMGYSSIRGFFEAIDKPAAKFTTVMGERPDVWLYITGPTHHRLSSIKREAAQLLPSVETFTAFAGLLKGASTEWPSKSLDQAWQDELYIDHGIGGKNGHITDEVFRAKVESARDTAKKLLDASLVTIASQVKTVPDKGTPITVFNTLSWKRSASVEVAITGAFHIVDEAGVEVPSQLTSLGIPDEVNVATAGKATASSMFSAEYGADKAIDGRWNVCDPNPETGASAKWNSGSGAGPHWLMVDFGKRYPIHKVVLYHEGVMGAYGAETKDNTSDYQIQGSDAAEGPWTDLTPRVSGNTASLTTHSFGPKNIRFLRVFVTKGALTDAFARIYEVQAFTKVIPGRRLVFVATDVPSLGYKSYYLVPGAPATAEPNPVENDFYRITLAPGGIKNLFDKQQNRELLDTGRFLGGEVFSMLSVAPNNRGAGTDAGEFGSVPLPIMDDTFDRVATHKPEWKVIESGPVRTVHQLEQALADTTVRQRLVVWHSLKQLDCEVDLCEFSGRLWREFRMALPLAADKPKFAYEVPMGVVEIGKDEIQTTGGHAYGGLTYSDPCRDIHPRVMQNFVDASDDTGGLTMSSSVSVFDWVDPTVKSPGKPVLQPVLLASRKSCNGAGNWYPQAGDHTFRFPLTSHVGGWRKNWHDGMAANFPLIPVMAGPRSDASLPPEMSFCSLSADNLVISTIKKSGDGKSMVARLWDIEGRDTKAEIRLFFPVREAQLTNMIEEGDAAIEITDGKVMLPIGHHAIETIKLYP